MSQNFAYFFDAFSLKALRRLLLLYLLRPIFIKPFENTSFDQLGKIEFFLRVNRRLLADFPFVGFVEIFHLHKIIDLFYYIILIKIVFK